MINPIKNKTLISRQDFENRLKDFGLKLDMSMICKYIDRHPQNQECYNTKHPKVFTIEFVDKKGHGWANIYGDYYKTHTTLKTDLHREFLEFKEFHTFKVGAYYFIA